MKTTDFAKYLSDFMTIYLINERGFSNNTIKAYRDAFVQLISYMETYKKLSINKLTLADITKENVVAFLDWIEIERHCSVSTRNGRLAAIHSFIKYVQRVHPDNLYEFQRVLAIKSKKHNMAKINYLTIEGIKLLLEMPDKSSRHGRRDLALLSLMYDTGCRVQEIADLVVENVHLSNPSFIMIKGKGKKIRNVPMLQEQTTILRQYMQENGLMDNMFRPYPLFMNSHREKLTRGGITHILKKYVETDCKLLCAVVTASKGFVRESVGDNVSEDRVDVITAAYSLVGKVGYFWGGKSTAIGNDPSWGAVEKVSAEGSKSSGTLRAYGLDCSGFVTWAVINGYQDQGMQAAVGDGTSDQWEKANVVSEADAQPGDLVFQRGPESGSNNHVGILCGKTDSGDWIAVHCSSSKNGVTVGEAYSASFRYIRQPSFYDDTAVEEVNNEGTATETDENAEKVLTDIVKSSALKDALASGGDISSDNLLEDFKNTSLQEDEDEEIVENLILEQEDIDDTVDTYDDVETLELEN